jgi:hypothetical protein
VKYFDWNDIKNTYLKTERGIGFDDVQAAVEGGKILADIEHPLKSQYPNQRVFIIEFNDYVYIVPYVEDATKIFLKTIYPSRKMTKKYLRGGKNI